MRPPRKLTFEELHDLDEEITYHKAEIERMQTHGGYSRSDMQYHRWSLEAAMDRKHIQDRVFNNRI